MEGKSTMYNLRPLSLVPETIDLPSCMYKVEPLSLNKSPSVSMMEPELQAIYNRQLEVIVKLRNMKNVVDGMVKNLGAGAGAAVSAKTVTRSKAESATSPEKGTPSTEFRDIATTDEVVIEANPNRPPLSIKFFSKKFPEMGTVNHVHSSCKENIPQNLSVSFTNDSVSPSLTVRVVWKGSGTRLTPTKIGSCGIDGESNVARYLSRLLSKPETSLHYDTLPLRELVLVDNVLRSSESVDSNPFQFMDSLLAYTKKGAKGRTIADYVGYSTLEYATKKKLINPVPASLSDWMQSLSREF